MTSALADEAPLINEEDDPLEAQLDTLRWSGTAEGRDTSATTKLRGRATKT